MNGRAWVGLLLGPFVNLVQHVTFPTNINTHTLGTVNTIASTLSSSKLSHSVFHFTDHYLVITDLEINICSSPLLQFIHSVDC